MLRNWEKLIYDNISKVTYRDNEFIKYIKEDIYDAYRFEFIDEKVLEYMLSELSHRINQTKHESELYHLQRMEEIREKQEKLLIQKEVTSILKIADDQWIKSHKKPVGRPRKETILKIS